MKTKLASLVALCLLSLPSAFAKSATGKITCGRGANIESLTLYFGKDFAVVEEFTFYYGARGEKFTVKNYRVNEGSLRDWSYYNYSTLDTSGSSKPGPGDYFYTFSITKKAVTDQFTGQLNDERLGYYLNVGVGRDYFSSDHIWVKDCHLSWVDAK